MRTFFITIIPLFFFTFVSNADSRSFEVFNNGKAIVNIINHNPEDGEVVSAAKNLQTYLSQIGGSKIQIISSKESQKGLVLALNKSLSWLPEKDKQKLSELNSEGYLVKVDHSQVIIIGNSGKAISHGIFDLLEEIGCRWLIPSKHWTIIPEDKNLHIKDMYKLEEPDLRWRSIWYAYGYGIDESRETLKADYETWFKANRLGGLAPFNSGHSYGNTVGKYKDIFQSNPNFFAMKKDGTRLPFEIQQSLCYSNEDVGKLFVKHRVEMYEENKKKSPYNFMVSMDPNDSSVPCYCEPCKKLGNGTDQAIYLANKVARALKEKFPEAVVGMYAYASHRLPPANIKPEPNIYIQVAMGFNKTKYTLDELTESWSKQVSGIGIREYYGVMAWDWGLPGRSRGGKISYIKKSISKYKNWKVNAFNAETNANWGAFGPGHYLAAKLLWSANSDSEKIINDYMEKAFGKGAELMKRFYELPFENSQLTRSNMHKWITLLDKAYQLAKDEPPEVHRRFEDMMCYFNYVSLYRKWEIASKSKDVDQSYSALKDLLTFTWRIRKKQVVHSYALQRRLVNSGAPILRPLRKAWRFDDKNAVWKDNSPISTKEILAIHKQNMLLHPVDKRIKKFSNNLVQTNFKKVNITQSGHLRQVTHWHLLIDKDELKSFPLSIKGTRGNYSITIFNRNGTKVSEMNSRISLDDNGSKFGEVTFNLTFPEKGLFLMKIAGREHYNFLLPDSLNHSCEASPDCYVISRANSPMFFYVPKETKTIFVKGGDRFSILPPNANQRTDYFSKDETQNGCLEIPTNGQDGKIWRITKSTSGQFYFLNIPPYFSQDPSLLLLPKEIVEKDNLK